MDVLSPSQRHLNMSHIKGRDTAPEKIIRKALHHAGFRYRICDRRYPGKPDIVLPRYHTVIFINGCFWHAHQNCRYHHIPKTNQPFWTSKFQRNVERDRKTIDYYKDICWRICVVWECAIRGRNSSGKIDNVTSDIIQWLEEPDSPFLEIRSNEPYIWK